MNSSNKSIQYWIMRDSHTAIAVGSSEFGATAALPEMMGRPKNKRTAMIVMKAPALDMISILLFQ